MIKICIQCNLNLTKRKKNKFCSQTCHGLFRRDKEDSLEVRNHKKLAQQLSFASGRKSSMYGKKFSEEHRKKISDKLKGNKNGIFNKSGHKQSLETRLKISFAFRGTKHPNWIHDRTKLKIREDRRSTAYNEWRKNIWLRDNFICKINNNECIGGIVAHHILPWRDYKELRYDINNGITLCHYHHPRKFDEEKKLSPYFQSLIKMV